MSDLKKSLREMRAAARRKGKVDKRGCKGCRDKMLKRMQSRLTIGAVIPSFNEGAEARATVDDIVGSVEDKSTQLLPILIDDGSTDGSCEGLSQLKHDEPWGLGRSRNQGLDWALAKGADVVTFHDAHMRFPNGVLEALARKALETGAIVTSKAKGWWGKDGKPHPFRAWGADMFWNLRDGLQSQYRIYCKDQPEWARVACPMGACYVVSREAIERLRGPTGRFWDDVQGRWGFSEQALAIKAFLLGVPILVSRDLATHHHYRDRNPVSNAGEEMWRNVTGSMAALLHEETFDERFRAYCEMRLGEKAVAEIGQKVRAGPTRELPWKVGDERKIFTHLLGRHPAFDRPHDDHAWLKDLLRVAQQVATPLARPMRIFQWRAGESTIMLRRHFGAAEIQTVEWVGHRGTNMRPWCKAHKVNLLQVDFNAWTNPPVEGQYDLVTIGGDRQDECKAAAMHLCAKDSKIVVNPEAEHWQIEDSERHKVEAQLKESKITKLPQEKSEVPTITVLLLNWRRPENVGPILDMLARQTARPKVMIWDNGVGDSGPLQMQAKAADTLVPIERHPLVSRVVRPDENMGCMPRWWLASMVDTEFACSLDDDMTFTDERFLADAMRAQRARCPEGIVGPCGWRREEGLPYKKAKHFNGKHKQDQRVDIVKGRCMIFPKRLLARVPLALDGIDLDEDDVYMSLCISRGKQGAHLIPKELSERTKALGKEDGRSRALRPGHYAYRDEMIRKLVEYWKG